MADQKTSIVITAEDRASAALAKLRGGISDLSRSVAFVAPQLAALGGALSVGSIAAYAKQTIDLADSFNDMAERTGMSVKSLAEWRLAIEQNGGSMDSLATGMKNLSVYLVEHGDKLRAAGITAKDSRGAFMQLADLFKALPEGPERAALSVEIFKRAGQDLLPVLIKGSEELRNSAEKSRDYARALSELAPKADEFNDTLTEIKLNLEASAINSITPYLDSLTRMARLFNEATQSGTGLKNLLAEMQAVTGSGPLSTFGAASRGVDLAYLLGYGADASKRSASGRIGGAALPDASLTAEQKDALKRSRPLLAGSGSKGKSDLEKMLELGRKNQMDDYYRYSSEEEMQAAIAKNTEQSARSAQQMAEAHERSLAALREMTTGGKMEILRKQQDLAIEAMTRADGSFDFEGYDEIMDQLAGLRTEGKDTFSDLQRAVEGWGKSAANAFADFAISGKGSISDLVSHVAREFVAMQTYPLFRDLMKGGSDWLAGLFKSNADGGVYAGAGISAYSGQVVSRPTLFPFASGVGLMGEAGPEAILPLKRGADGKLGVTGGGSNVVVNVIEAPGKGGQQQVRQEGNARVLDVFVERIKSSIAGDISAGRGDIPAALAGSYGLNRAAGSY